MLYAFNNGLGAPDSFPPFGESLASVQHLLSLIKWRLVTCYVEDSRFLHYDTAASAPKPLCPPPKPHMESICVLN